MSNSDFTEGFQAGRLRGQTIMREEAAKEIISLPNHPVDRIAERVRGLPLDRLPDIEDPIARLTAERDALREALEFARPALELLATEEARRNMHCGNRGLPIKTTAAERLAKADAALNSTDGDTRR